MKSEREQRLYTGAAGGSSALIGPDLVARAPQLLSYWTKMFKMKRETERTTSLLLFRCTVRRRRLLLHTCGGAQLQQHCTHMNSIQKDKMYEQIGKNKNTLVLHICRVWVTAQYLDVKSTEVFEMGVGG